MNRIIQLTIGVLIILCCSCKHEERIKELKQIDNLIYHDPDSAILYLNQLSDSIKDVPTNLQMYYQLLTIKANDKAYITHTTDSLILSIVSYYEKKKEMQLLPEAYYYAGRVYSDLYDSPKALDYFQRAIELLKDGTNYKLLKVIYSQMGHLLLYQDVYDEAMKAFREACRYNTILGDRKGEIINLCWIGETFTGYGNADSALHYFREAQQKAINIDEENLICNTKRHLASLYNQLENFDSVKVILNTYNGPINTTYHEILGEMYIETNQLDSAIYYYNKVLEEKEMYTSQRAYLKLAEIAMKKGDAKAALEHTRKYKEWTTEIAQATNSETIHKMHSYYNYQLREKENNRLRLENEQQEKWIIAGVFTVLLLICFCIGYTQYSRRKRALLNIQLNKLEQLKEEQYHKSILFIEENNRKIKDLETRLQQSYRESSDMQKLLLTQKEQIQQMNERIETDKKEQQLSEKIFRQSGVYNKFHDAVNDTGIKILTGDWEALRTQTDECYKGFTSRLRGIYPLSEMELRICLLLKIGINVTGIATLCGRSKSAVVSARKRLYEKFFAQSGKPEQWDEFILSL